MAFSTDNSMVMPVAPAYSNGGFGGLGGDFSGWLILFLIFGMFGNGFGGFGGNNFSYDFPWLLNGQNNTDSLVTNGFNNAAVTNSLNGIQSSITSGFGDVQNALCGGFAGTTAAVTGAQNALTQQMYANQIADMERSFNAQTTQMQGMNTIASNLQNCCCENRASVADLKYSVATEACADRNAISNGVKDIIANQTANTQAILDKLCQQEIDSLKTANSNLQTQVLMRDLAASQSAQTNQLIADNTAQTQYIVNRVAPYPIPAYQVASPYAYGCA